MNNIATDFLSNECLKFLDTYPLINSYLSAMSENFSNKVTKKTASKLSINEQTNSQIRKSLENKLFSAKEIADIFLQWELRQKAVAKFGAQAPNMLLTRDGLEQASQKYVSSYHANLFVKAGIKSVADLGCGLGAESLSSASNGLTVYAVDLDATTASYAKHNLARYTNAQVYCQSAESFLANNGGENGADNSTNIDVIFADPARRNSSGRINNPEKWSPSLSEVLSWQKYCADICVKIAPGIDYSFLPADWHVQWISADDALVEALLISPALAEKLAFPALPKRSAVLIDQQGLPHIFWAEGTECANAKAASVAIADGIQEYLLEADSAIIRSGALKNFAEKVNAKIISPDICYLTCNNPIADNELLKWAKSYQITEMLPLKPKIIARYLREHNISRVDIKKRGWQGDPAQFRRQILPKKSLQSAEPKTATIVLTQIHGKHQCLVVEPLITK